MGSNKTPNPAQWVAPSPQTTREVVKLKGKNKWDKIKQSSSLYHSKGETIAPQGVPKVAQVLS